MITGRMIKMVTNNIEILILILFSKLGFSSFLPLLGNNPNTNSREYNH